MGPDRLFRPPDQLAQELAQHFFSALPAPVLLLDARGRVLGANLRAQRLWESDERELQGLSLASGLGLVRLGPDADDIREALTPIPPGLLTGQPWECQLTSRSGAVYRGTMVGWPLPYRGTTFTVLILTEERTEGEHRDHPAWAAVDPVTGLKNRLSWTEGLDRWSRRRGILVILDMDDLKGVNDLYGHAAGDGALKVIGTALKTLETPAVIPLRYGGDEFLLVGLGKFSGQGIEVEQWIRHVQDALDMASERGTLPVRASVSWGFAKFRAGELEAALRAADEDLYARKGTLLKTRGGSRLVLRRSTIMEVRGPESDEQDVPTGVGQFGPKFASAVSVLYPSVLQEAQMFTQFVGVEADAAVVEVGAGNGRLAIDGGMAPAVGAGGVLLLTDPSAAQIRIARQRAHDAGYGFMRFVEASAERLPLSSHEADLAVGAWFLHLCDAPRAVAELARVTRAGGRVGLDAPLEPPFSPVWSDIFSPLRQALADQGGVYRPVFHQEGEVPALCERVGLTVERTHLEVLGPLEFPDPVSARQYFEQGGLMELLVRPLPRALRDAVVQAIYARMTQAFAETKPEERRLLGRAEYVIARQRMTGPWVPVV